MWLLNTESQVLHEFSGKLPVETLSSLPATPRYAILSHCWDKGDSEVLFKDIQDLNQARWKPGYSKVQECCNLAFKTGYKWVWVDTCCIDKSSSAELSEAINSMFKWYEHADACFVYLDDVDNEEPRLPNSSFRKSRWFTRGWTLQELLAPQQVMFFSKTWSFIGTKDSLLDLLNSITKIPIDALSHRRHLNSFSVAQRMSWAANRETTRIEDQAYSLMGFFEIFMPIIYGEGRSAFRRLQLEIIQHSNDQTIFAWSPEESKPYPLVSSIIHGDVRNHQSSPDVEFPFFWGPGHSSILAPSPAGFAGSGCIVPLPTSATPRSPSAAPSDVAVYSWTHLGLQIRLPLIPAKTAVGDDQRYIGVLPCWHPREHSMYGIPLKCDRTQDGVYYCSDWSVDGSSGRLVSIPERAYDDMFSSKLAVPRDVYITNQPDPFNTRHDRLLNDTSYPDNLASCWAQLTVVFSALSIQRLEQMGFLFDGHAPRRVRRSSQVVEVRKLAAGDIVSECRLPPCDDNPPSRRSSSRGYSDPPSAQADLLFLNKTAKQAFSIVVSFSRRNMMTAVAINPEIELHVVFYRPEDVPTLAGQAVYDDHSLRSPRAERRPEPYAALSRHVAVQEPSASIRLLFFGKMSEAVRGTDTKEFCDREHERSCLSVSTTKWEVRDEAKDVVYGTVWVELSSLARTEPRVRR